MNPSPRTPGPVRVELGGVGIEFSTDNAALTEYAARHLEPLANAAAVPSIRARLQWHEGNPSGPREQRIPELASMERLDRDLYRGGDVVRWFRIDELPDLELRFAWDGQNLQVDGTFHYRLSKDAKRDFLKRLVYKRRLPGLRQRRFTTLLYYLVYYPAFWWLERQHGFHPIHAAGFELDDRLIVLPGPSGVGKSTLSAGMAAFPGGRFLSDTFLLHRGAEVLPVREPLLVDSWSRQWMGEGATALQPIDWRYCLDRGGFHFDPQRISPGGTADLVVFPHRSPTPGLQELSPRQAHARISSADFLINDLRRYWAYAAVLETFDPSLLVEAREESLRQLTAAVPCYDLGLTRELDRAEIRRWFDALARDVAHRGTSTSTAAAGD